MDREDRHNPLCTLECNHQFHRNCLRDKISDEDQENSCNSCEAYIAADTISELNLEASCPICYEDLTSAQRGIVLPCKHEFCYSCMWKQIYTGVYQRTCAYCRKEITAQFINQYIPRNQRPPAEEEVDVAALRRENPHLFNINREELRDRIVPHPPIGRPSDPIISKKLLYRALLGIGGAGALWLIMGELGIVNSLSYWRGYYQGEALFQAFARAAENASTRGLALELSRLAGYEKNEYTSNESRLRDYTRGLKEGFSQHSLLELLIKEDVPPRVAKDMRYLHEGALLIIDAFCKKKVSNEPALCIDGKNDF